MAEKMEELNSRMSPGLGLAQGGMISSPVGMMPTTGRRMTSSSSTPPAIMAPMAAGLTSMKPGRIISPAQISSPIWRMCCQGAAAAWMVMLPSSFFTMSSTMMTASQPSGIGSPVSTTANCSGVSVLGVVSVAPKLSAAWIATPSMALAA